MPITVKFIGAFRHISGKTQLNIESKNLSSLKDLVLKIVEEMPKLKENLIDQQSGEPKPNALTLINGREISVLNGLDTKLNDGDEVVFVPVVHGG